MTLSITLDWLAFTTKEWGRRHDKFMSNFAGDKTNRATSPRNGYTAAIEHENGVVHMWNDNREEMGHHVIISGSSLRNIFEHTKISQRDLLEATLKLGGSITRLDVAKDATHEPINLGAIWDCVQSTNIEGTARTFTKIEDHKGNRTIYIGSRTSERFARIYDKRGQLGDKGFLWYRYELETKGMVARALASLLANQGTWTGAFDEMALNMLDISNSPDYATFFSNDEVRIGIPKIEKRTDREKWIQSQVISAIIEHYQEHPDSEAIKLLRRTLDFLDEQAKRD